MIADASGVMPDLLEFDADKRFFERGLDRVDVVVHGRHSHEQQPHSHLRLRLIVTRRVAALGADPSNRRAMFWNPAGGSFPEALAVLGPPNRRVGVVGGTDVFGLFLDLYDIFHLTRTPDVRLPGGRPVFPGVPARTPEEMLAKHGLAHRRWRLLDRSRGLAVQTWIRSARCVPNQG